MSLVDVLGKSIDPLESQMSVPERPKTAKPVLKPKPNFNKPDEQPQSGILKSEKGPSGSIPLVDLQEKPPLRELQSSSAGLDEHATTLEQHFIPKLQSPMPDTPKSRSQDSKQYTQESQDRAENIAELRLNSPLVDSPSKSLDNLKPKTGATREVAKEVSETPAEPHERHLKATPPPPPPSRSRSITPQAPESTGRTSRNGSPSVPLPPSPCQDIAADARLVSTAAFDWKPDSASKDSLPLKERSEPPQVPPRPPSRSSTPKSPVVRTSTKSFEWAPAPAPTNGPSSSAGTKDSAGIIDRKPSIAQVARDDEIADTDWATRLPPVRLQSSQREFDQVQLDSGFVDRQPLESATSSKLPSGKEAQSVFLTERYLCVGNPTGVTVYETSTYTPLWDAPKQRASSLFVLDDVLWVGTTTGVIWTCNVTDGTDRETKADIHRGPVQNIFQYGDSIMSLSSEGRANLWLDNSASNMPLTALVATGFENASLSGDHLWLVYKDGLSIYKIDLSDRFRLVQVKQLCWTGRRPSDVPVSNGYLCIDADDVLVVCGHRDGYISAYSAVDMQPLYAFKAGAAAVTSIVKNGGLLWVGLQSGHVLVIELSDGGPVLVKDWKASKEGSPIKTLRPVFPLTLLCRSSSIMIYKASLTRELGERAEIAARKEGASKLPIKLRILTWNVDACKPGLVEPKLIFKAAGLDKLDGSVPDILAVGLQEVVELENKTKTARNLVMKSDNNTTKEYDDWKMLLNSVFELEEYILLTSKAMVGLYSCVYAHKSILENISDVQNMVVKTGMGGLHGNKGGIISRFEIWDTSVCLINCHLAAGHSNIVQRNRDSEAILQAAGAVPPSASSSTTSLSSGLSVMPLDHDFLFFYGDTNYRINTARELAVKHIAANNLERLRTLDQLAGQMIKNPLFPLSVFEEAPINFPPTYKFDRGTDAYDTSDKRRVPSWCDRILYRGHKISVTTYTSLKTYQSDHRPVVGEFSFSAEDFSGSVTR